MTYVLIGGWVVCGLFAVWRYATDMGQLKLWELIFLTLGGPFTGLLGLFIWLAHGCNLNPTLWEKKR